MKGKNNTLKKVMMKRPLLRSFEYAFRGICIALKTERSFRLHAVALVLVIATGIYVGITVWEWGLVVFVAGFVLTAELFNTTIERISDEVCKGQQSEVIRNIKDISAAAVIMSALTALAVGLIVLIIPLIQKIAGLF
jgi:diacylglycerol kinase